jgi:hypothetical protein
MLRFKHLALLLALGAALVPRPSAADNTVQTCANLFEDLIAMRAQRAGLQVVRFTQAQARILAPASALANLPSEYRHFDIGLIDRAEPDRVLTLEATIGGVRSPVKRIQLEKDGLGIQYGVNFPQLNLTVAPGKLKVVWVTGYRPAPSTLKDMKARGIGYFNFLSGESNVMELNDYYRPSMAVMKGVLIPGPLTEYERRLAENQLQMDTTLVGALDGLRVIVEIGGDIVNALQHKEKTDERRRALALSIQEARHQYGANETFLLDITSGSDAAGPFGELWPLCTPTLTYIHVADAGPYKCKPGEQQELPTISAQGQHLRSVRVCMVGLGATLPGGGGYKECEVMQDPDCKTKPAAEGTGTPRPPAPTPTPTPTPTPVAAGQVTAEASTDRRGSDYGYFAPAQANYELCRAACASDNKCRAYTYVQPGVQAATPMCYLKNAVPAPSQSGCCISGVKQ